jgi:hypothetical protein
MPSFLWQDNYKTFTCPSWYSLAPCKRAGVKLYTSDRWQYLQTTNLVFISRSRNRPCSQIWSSLLFFNRHGTKCAAVIAGAANNGICGVGVAYEADIAGILLALIKYLPVLIYIYIYFKNSLIIQEQNTKKNHKRVVVLYVIKNHVNLHKL